MCENAGVVVVQSTCKELALGKDQDRVWDWWQGLDIFKGLVNLTAAWEELRHWNEE